MPRNLVSRVLPATMLLVATQLDSAQSFGILRSVLTPIPTDTQDDAPPASIGPIIPDPTDSVALIPLSIPPPSDWLAGLVQPASTPRALASSTQSEAKGKHYGLDKRRYQVPIKSSESKKATLGSGTIPIVPEPPVEAPNAVNLNENDDAALLEIKPPRRTQATRQHRQPGQETPEVLDLTGKMANWATAGGMIDSVEAVPVVIDDPSVDNVVDPVEMPQGIAVGEPNPTGEKTTEENQLSDSSVPTKALPLSEDVESVLPTDQKTSEENPLLDSSVPTKALPLSEDVEIAQPVDVKEVDNASTAVQHIRMRAEPSPSSRGPPVGTILPPVLVAVAAVLAIAVLTVKASLRRRHDGDDAELQTPSV